MEIYKKIAKAKEEIKSTDLKKNGHNDYSNYDYFTPEQIESLVFNACKNNELITTFNLIRNEFGITGILHIIDINSDEAIKYEMATDVPAITATNIAQQLGGCMTYTERYLKMSAFGITENALDFDDKDHKKTESKKEYKEDNRPWLSDKQKVQAIEKIRHADFGDLSKAEFKNKLYSEFKMKKIYKEDLDVEFNSPFNEALNK